MLTNLREAIRPYVEGLGKACGVLLPYPTAWTTFGLAFSVLAGYYFYLGSVQQAGLFVLLSGLMDVLDGAVARAVDKVSPSGAFLDSNIDRLSEVSLFVGILWSGLVGPTLVLLTLSFSLLVSYSRARAEGLGLKAEGVGIGERAERLLALAIAGLVGQLYWGVLIVLALASLTFVQRVYIYSSRL
jgi:archaetidylinositol phosphate synthase